MPIMFSVVKLQRTLGIANHVFKKKESQTLAMVYSFMDRKLKLYSPDCLLSKSHYETPLKEKKV